MYARAGDNGFEALELPDDESPVCPWTCVGDIEMIATGFRGEFSTFHDEVPELRLSAFELARFITGSDPVRDLTFCLSCY
jgi:hypothetical protein